MPLMLQSKNVVYEKISRWCKQLYKLKKKSAVCQWKFFLKKKKKQIALDKQSQLSCAGEKAHLLSSGKKLGSNNIPSH